MSRMCASLECEGEGTQWSLSSPAGRSSFPLLHLLHHLQQAINLSQGQLWGMVCETGPGRAARTPVCKQRQVGGPGSFPKQLQGLPVGKAGCGLVVTTRKGKKGERGVGHLSQTCCFRHTVARRGHGTDIETDSRSRTRTRLTVSSGLLDLFMYCAHIISRMSATFPYVKFGASLLKILCYTVHK